jgi:hypothetical protein
MLIDPAGPHIDLRQQEDPKYATESDLTGFISHCQFSAT